MKLYADHGARRTAQLVADLGALLIIAVSVWLAMDLYDLVSKLRAPGVELVEAGGSLRELSTSAAAQAGRLPLVGDELAAALGRGSAVADRLVDAGNKQMSAVDSTALWLSVLLVLVPVSLLLVSWLPLRARFVRQATAARRLTRLGEAHVDLLALRGLANLPLHTLAKPGVDLVGAWRSGDRAATELLASKELRRLGLRLETGTSER